MPETHLIEELRLELAFSTEREALAGQAPWDALLKHRLLAVAGEVFDESSVPGEIVRFDSLQVDLGVADPRMDAVELERRMRDGLRRAMQDGLRQAAEGARAGARIVTRAYSDLDLVASFLVSGYLPWHGGRHTTRSFEDLIRRTLEASGPDFARWLRGGADRPGIVRRLARQFPEDMLEHVAALLAPERDSFIGALARLLPSLFNTAGAGTATGASADRLVWEALIGTALERDCTARDDVWFARQAMKRTARLHGGSNSATAEALRAALAKLRAMPEPAFDVAGALRILRNATTPHAVEPALPAAGARAAGDVVGPASSISHRLRARLDSAILHGDAPAVAAHWRTLVAEHGALLVATVRLHGRFVAVRRRLAEGFPEPMLLDVVGLLEPLHAEFIREVVSGSRALPGRPGPAAQPGARRRRMWEFTLTYLLVERGGTFNKRAYLGSVIRQMAAHDNAAYEPVLTMLIAALEGTEARSALQEEMLDLLRELNRDSGGEPDTGPGADACRDLVEAACAYDDLAAHLSLKPGRPSNDGTSLVTILDRLAARYPWQFVRLAGELKHGGTSVTRIAARLSVAELHRLVLAVVAGVRAGAFPAGREFSDALDDHATRAPDAREFYAHVLERVLEAKPLDLAAIAGDCEEPAPVSHAPPPHDEPAAPGSADGLRRAQLEAWIAGGRIELLAPVWAELVRERPVLARSAIRDQCRFTGARRALVLRATDSMLVDIVRLLAPAQADFICDVVQRPDWFRDGACESAGDTRGDRRRLWELTLSYLVVERGGRFNRRAYIGSLVRQMAAHDNLAVADLLRALIAMFGEPQESDALHLEMVTLLRELAEEPASTQAVARPARLPRRNATRMAAHADATPDTGGVDRAALTSMLHSGGTPGAAGRRRLVDEMRRALTRAPEDLRRVLARDLEDVRAIARLVDTLPEGELTGVLVLLRPQDAARALRTSDLIATAALSACAGGSSSSEAGDTGGGATRASAAQMTRWKWRFLLGELLAQGRTFDVTRFAGAFVAHLAKMFRARDLQRLRDDIARHVIERATPPERALARAIADALASSGVADDGKSARTARAVPDSPARGESGVTPGALYVANAGQVLATPYLPRLFAMLGLVADDRFRDTAAAGRAVHLLQFMVDGTIRPPEHLLALNKLLCGVALDAPIEREIVLTEEERQAVEGMIQGMIHNWTAIGHTSVTGMRESFFQREGRLQRKADAWRLLVEPRAFDMLLDRIPWGYSTIRHPWMEKVVHVEWR